jgi:DNA-binding response OmpR family regulator
VLVTAKAVAVWVQDHKIEYTSKHPLPRLSIRTAFIISQLFLSKRSIIKNMRILIVEDEYKIAGAVKKGLEQESFAVDAVYDGDDGMDSAMSGEYDLVILDYMLPGELNGLDIIKAMRKEGIHIPVIFVTAKDSTSDRVNGLDAGADDYLVKPFAFEELLARVRALLRRPKETLPTVLTQADLSLDLAALRVTRSGREIELTQKEFALLEYLMRNPGRILTKENIIAHVWDYDADILPNTVEVYIGYLRNKVDKGYKNKPLIQTRRGFGYMFGENGHV